MRWHEITSVELIESWFDAVLTFFKDELLAIYFKITD